VPEQIWHNEVGAPDIRITKPFEGYVLTPQDFSNSSLALGPMLNRSGTYSLSSNTTEDNSYAPSSTHKLWSHMSLVRTHFYLWFDINNAKLKERTKATKCFKISKGELLYIYHVSRLRYFITNKYSPQNPELSKAWISYLPYLRTSG
jgi:hypothetical protein